MNRAHDDRPESRGGHDSEELLNLEDMLVETPVPLMRIANRDPQYERDGQHQCSVCGVGPDRCWYPNEDITVIRHWQLNDGDDPSGGTWWSYCPDHLDKWADKWWPNSHRAPAQLIPDVKHYCQRSISSRQKCGALANENVDGGWYCPPHAAAARTDLRIREILDDPGTED